MFTNCKHLAAAALALGLANGVASAQSFSYPQPGAYPQPTQYTQPVGYTQQPVGYPAPVAPQYPVPQQPAAFPQNPGYPQTIAYPAPVVVPEPPIRLGFQWAMCDYGMNVTALRDGGLAQQIGLLPGDMIVQMNAFQITGWDQYCFALHDAIAAHGGQVEMWLYRPTPAGYQLQYVSFTIHQERIVVVVPCCYHEVKCHSQHVSCWNDRLIFLNKCWKDHCHDGKAPNHHGLNMQFLGKGVNLNFHKGGVNVNLGNLMQKHGHGNHQGNFGGFNPNQFKQQIKQFSGNKDFHKQFDSHHGSNSKPKFNGNSFNFNNFSKSMHHSSNGGNSMKNFTQQFSRGGNSGHGGGHGRK